MGARFVPALKGGVLEGLSSVVVLFVSPRGVRPPVLGHNILLAHGTVSTPAQCFQFRSVNVHSNEAIHFVGQTGGATNLGNKVGWVEKIGMGWLVLLAENLFDDTL